MFFTRHLIAAASLLFALPLRAAERPFIWGDDIGGHNINAYSNGVWSLSAAGIKNRFLEAPRILKEIGESVLSMRRR